MIALITITKTIVLTDKDIRRLMKQYKLNTIVEVEKFLKKKYKDSDNIVVAYQTNDKEVINKETEIGVPILSKSFMGE